MTTMRKMNSHTRDINILAVRTELTPIPIRHHTPMKVYIAISYK